MRLFAASIRWNLPLDVVGKSEFLSAGGSVKDRIAKRMVLEAEKDGILIPGKSIVIEPTSGNTGAFHSICGGSITHLCLEVLALHSLVR